MSKRRLLHGALLAIAAGAGCAQLISFPDYQSSGSGGTATATGGTGGATSSTGGATSSSTSGSSTGGSSSSTGGAGGAACDADHPCTGSCQWSVNLGDKSSQAARSAAFTPEGDVVIAGVTNNLIFLGAGPDLNLTVNDGFVARVSGQDGKLALGFVYGDGLSTQDPRAVAVDAAGNIFVVGAIPTPLTTLKGHVVDGAYAGGADILVAKFAADGTVLWAKDFGAAGDDVATAIALDSAGTPWITGTASDGIVFGTSPAAAAGGFALHLDTDGVVLWSTTIPGVDGEGIAVDAQGHVAITGRASAGTDAAVDDNIALVRIGSDLVPHTDIYGDPALQDGKSVAFDPAGNLYLLAAAAGDVSFGGACAPLASPYPAGTIAGRDFMVARLDMATGACVWARRFPKLDTDPNVIKNDHRPSRIVADEAGNVILTGLVSGTIDFSGAGQAVTIAPSTSGVIIAKLRGADGAHVWSKGSSSTSNANVVYGLDARPGAIVVAGAHNQNMGLGCAPFGTVGFLDVDVTKLSP